MMRINEAKLTAYLDGELPQAEREWIAAQIAKSPQLQAKLTQLRQEVDQINQALDLLAPVPAIEKSTALDKAFISSPSLLKDGGLSQGNPLQIEWESPSLFSMLKTGLQSFRFDGRLFLKTSFVVATAIAVIVGISLYGEFLNHWVVQPPETTEPVVRPEVSPSVQLVQPTVTVTHTPEAKTIVPDKIIFTAGDPFESGYIYSMNHDGSDLQLIQRLTVINSVLSPDGQRLAIEKSGGDIYVMNIDGTDLINLTNSPDKYESFPVWSPDGQKIIFETVEAGRESSPTIEMINVNGANRINTGENSMDYLMLDGSNISGLIQRPSRLAKSPDGQKMAYVATGSIYTIDADGTNPFLVAVPPPGYDQLFNITWSPDGQRLTFLASDTTPMDEASMDEPPPRELITLFTVNLDGTDLSPLTDNNLSVFYNYAWSPDGKEIAFTADGHIYVMNADGSNLIRLTEDAFYNPGNIHWWAPQRKPVIEEISKQPEATSIARSEVKLDLEFDYGIQVDPSGDVEANIAHLKKLGFNWVKLQMPWQDVQRAFPGWHWDPFDQLIEEYAKNDIKVMLSITKAPHWARPEGDDTSVEGFPADPAFYADFVTVVARYYRGKVQAIEIWSEPNVWYEAGGAGRMNAENYVTLLQQAYRAIKIANPEMIVVSAGLAPTGNNSDLAIDDVDYLKQMYEAGAKGYFDALGAHPLGYNCPAMADWRTVTPEEATADPNSGLFTNRHHSWCFLGTMEAYREVMVANDDADTPIIITEFGWPVADRPWASDTSARDGADNSPEEQAQWIVEAYQWGEKQTWVGPMILWNLDYGVTNPDSPFADFSIVDTPAFEALIERNRE